jgi:hypothetical protein
MINKDWQRNVGKGQADRGLSIGSVVYITPPVKDKDGNVIEKGSVKEISWEDYISLKLNGKV